MARMSFFIGFKAAFFIVAIPDAGRILIIKISFPYVIEIFILGFMVV